MIYHIQVILSLTSAGDLVSSHGLILRETTFKKDQLFVVLIPSNYSVLKVQKNYIQLELKRKIDDAEICITHFKRELKI